MSQGNQHRKSSKRSFCILTKISMISLLLLVSIGFGSLSCITYAQSTQEKTENISAQNIDNEKTEVKDSLDLKSITKQKTANEVSVSSVFSSLIIVIGMIILSGWLYLHFTKGNPKLLLANKTESDKRNKLKVLSTANLGQGKNVYLIEVNNKQIVIGATPNSISLLTKINTEHQQEESPQNKPSKKVESPDPSPDNEEELNTDEFPDVFKDYLDKD